MAGGVNCSALATRTDFNAYASRLLNATDGNLERLSVCKNEVCGALWGYGNGDISGIGMIVGYILEHILGLILALVVLWSAYRKRRTLALLGRECLSSFHDCAIFFAFSIQIAATVVLVREDYGINANGMGDDTVRITQAVGMLVLLPLAYALLLLAPTKGQVQDTIDAVRLDQEPKGAASHPEVDKSSTHFTLFVLCWALAFYPFYSKMNAAFGPSKIAKHGHSNTHAVITAQQFEVIQNICFGTIQPLSVSEDRLMTALVMLAYIPLSILVIARIVWLGVKERHPNSKLRVRLLSLHESIPSRTGSLMKLIILGTVPLLASGLLWSIFRVRNLQQQMTSASGSHDTDSSWTFGQVVAVTVFTPVLVTGWNSRKKGTPTWAD